MAQIIQLNNSFGLDITKQVLIKYIYYISKSMNNLNGNAPWNLNQCTINKNDVNFFVKLVHVDRYQKVSKQNSRRQSIHIRKRHQQIEGEKLVKQFKVNSFVTPSKIISQIPLWNHRKQAQKTLTKKKSPLMIFQSRSPKSNKSKTGRSSNSFNQSPAKQNILKTQENQQSIQKLKKQFRTTLKFNKTLSIDFKQIGKRVATEPNQRMTQYNNTYTIPKSIKKQTMKQILFFKKQKVSKNRQFQLKRFKTTFNKAKFSNTFIKTENN